MELLIAVVATYITITYIFPILDLFSELLTYKISDIATSLKISAQTKAEEFALKYPNCEQKEPAIGFNYEQVEDTDEFDGVEEDDNECCDINQKYDVLNIDGKKSIGFKL